MPAPGVEAAGAGGRGAARLRCPDETPEGRSIVVLAKQKFSLRGRDLSSHAHVFHKFSAHTRTSGVDLEGRHLRKGSADAIAAVRSMKHGGWPAEVERVGG